MYGVVRGFLGQCAMERYGVIVCPNYYTKHMERAREEERETRDRGIHVTNLAINQFSAPERADFNLRNWSCWRVQKHVLDLLAQLIVWLFSGRLIAPYTKAFLILGRLHTFL